MGTRFLALARHVAVHVVDLGAAALDHVLGHRGAPVAARALAGVEHRVERVVHRRPAGVRPVLGRRAVELRDAVAEREADARRLLGEADRDRAAARARRRSRGSRDRTWPEPGCPCSWRRAWTSARPRGCPLACAPSITESISRQLLYARRDAAVVLARRGRRRGRRRCPSPRRARPGRASSSATPILDMMSPTDALRARDGGHDRIGPAVLGRHHVARRRQVAQGQLGRPGRVVGLHGDECDVEVGAKPLGLVQVQRRRPAW